MFINDKNLFNKIKSDSMDIISSLSNGKSNQAEIISEILDESYSSLKNIIRGTSELVIPENETNRKYVAAAYMELASFCNRYLSAENAKNYDVKNIPSFNEFPRVLVESLLDALKYGSSDAHLLFPRLLQIIESYPSCLPVFEERVSKMPCWLFIGWIDQMVALLDKPEAKAVQSIIEKIALTYPNAIIYAFHLSSGSYKFSNSYSDSCNKKFVEKIKSILEKETLITDFVAALDHLSVPSIIFKEYMTDLIQSVKAKASEDQIKQCFSKLNEKIFNIEAERNRRVPIGPLHKKFANDFKSKFLAICGKDCSKLIKEKDPKVALKALSDLVAEAGKKDKKLSSLKDASPWLSEFQQWKYSTQIEIPGQYSGKSKPLPEYHVKIAGFDGKVLILSSLTAPRRITIRGNDEKEYKILVKSGEDLRQDARIQQMFSVMNEIYAKDVNCAQRHLSLKTYKVVPLSTRLGLIEWVDNTTVLNDFLNDGMSETERKQFFMRDGRNVAQAEVLQWEKRAENLAAMYHSLYMNKTREECIQKYEKLVSLVPKNLLKKSFLKLSSSPEAFIALRNKFAKSHAVICISQWIIGIGDRHLGNFLIDKTSGCEIGIDFGHAFGSATQFLPVPELMPFRLTPQYLQLMSPLKVKGIYEATMIHALKAISNKQDLLLNVMDIFIKEPTLDWMNFANKQKQVMGTHNEVSNDDWFPRQRILIAQKKLGEFNPCYITRKELKLGHSLRPCFDKMASICMGDASYNVRTQIKKSGLSVEEKIESLIDQATDPYLLSLTYFGWSPWM